MEFKDPVAFFLQDRTIQITSVDRWSYQVNTLERQVLCVTMVMCQDMYGQGGVTLVSDVTKVFTYPPSKFTCCFTHVFFAP